MKTLALLCLLGINVLASATLLSAGVEPTHPPERTVAAPVTVAKADDRPGHGPHSAQAL